MSGKNAKLRNDLEILICEPINKIKDIDKKLHLVQQQNNRIAQLIGNPVRFPLDDGKFHYQLIINCYSYALQLWRFPEFVQAANDYTGEDNIIVSEKILSFINDLNLQEASNPKPRDLILYFGNNELKHAGLFQNDDMIESKWDKYGVFKHAKWHVPASYGNKVVAYELPKLDFVKQYFFDVLKI